MDAQFSLPPFALIAIYVWSLLVKGFALWRASKSDQRNWFIAILVLNSVGILELIYLFKFAKKPLTISEIRSLVQRDK